MMGAALYGFLLAISRLRDCWIEVAKGFAVVAGEVKHLATQTTDATDRIRSLVETVQSSVSLAVDAIGRIGGVVGRINAVSLSMAETTALQGQAADAIAIQGARLSVHSRDLAVELSPSSV